MKIKLIFIYINILFLIISVLQMLNIPPYAEDMSTVYKSGYFGELEREAGIIVDAFVSIKSMSANPAYAWIFLEDLQKNGITVDVCDSKSQVVRAPGVVSGVHEKPYVLSASGPGAVYSYASGGKYHTWIPAIKKSECSPCHSNVKEGNFIGALYFERDYDAHIYYSLERILIFGAVSLLLSLTLFFLIRWTPERGIKEMFDKDE
ncbi:MAG: hypothetical protein LBT84_01100 [Spirochaetia bacterium]|jgi:hypothetical protein|nr:hypothetical protein [Spirochaetia bacterium]